MSLETWAQEVVAAMSLLQAASYRIANMANVPQEGDPAHRLEVLLGVLQQMGVVTPNESLDPGSDYGRNVAGSLASSEASLRGIVRDLVYKVQDEVTDSLRKGAFHAHAVLTSDFVELTYRRNSTNEGRPAATVLGLVDSLPPGHPARSVLPPDGFYRVEGRPVLVLGAAKYEGEWPFGKAYPRSWYDLNRAAIVTTGWRNVQRADEAEERRRREHEEALQVQRASNPQGAELARLRLENSQLHDQLRRAQAPHQEQAPPF